MQLPYPALAQAEQVPADVPRNKGYHIDPAGSLLVQLLAANILGQDMCRSIVYLDISLLHDTSNVYYAQYGVGF